MNKFFEQIFSHSKGKKQFYLKVKILSNMPHNQIVGQLEHEGEIIYKIWIAAKPVRGAANQELCRFLKKTLHASEVVIVSGGRDKVKLVRVSSQLI